MATNNFAPLAASYQDLERMQFAQNLRVNPSDYANYVSTRVDELSNEVFNRKRTAFQKADIDLARYMDMDHNAGLYKARAGDVNRLTDALASNNTGIQQALSRDKDVSRRQFEINEWYNYNKLETLFFLQVFFMASLSMAVVIFLQKTQTITTALAGLLTLLLVATVVITGLYRYFYTTRTRDPRLWHRRFFGTTAAPSAPAATCSAGGTMDFDVNALIPKPTTQCVDEATQNFGAWQDALKQEMIAYQSTGSAPSALSGAKTLGGKVCSALGN